MGTASLLSNPDLVKALQQVANQQGGQSAPSSGALPTTSPGSSAVPAATTALNAAPLSAVGSTADTSYAPPYMLAPPTLAPSSQASQAYPSPGSIVPWSSTGGALPNANPNQIKTCTCQ